MKQIIWFFESFSGYEILYLIFFLGFLIMTCTLPLVTIFIARKFDPLFKEKTIQFYVLGLNRLSRSSWYAGALLMPTWLRTRPNTLVYSIFKNYNLWENATIFERILACMHIIPGLIAVLAIIIYYTHHFIFEILLH